MNNFTPRLSQQEILKYRGGRLGIAAVPGAGKTHILSALAAQIIHNGSLGADQEVLIVTLVNSAVDNFSRRVAGFVAERGLLPHVGYRVRTLHGLAHDVVRERPSLAGLSDDFQIIDEATSAQILHDAVNAWIHAHPGAADDAAAQEHHQQHEYQAEHQLPGAAEMQRGLEEIAQIEPDGGADQRPEQGAGAARDAAVVQHPPRGTETILIIDDEVTLLDLTKEILEGLGYRVVTAEGALEGIRIYKDQQADIDLVVADNRYSSKVALRNAELLIREKVEAAFHLTANLAFPLIKKPAPIPCRPSTLLLPNVIKTFGL